MVLNLGALTSNQRRSLPARCIATALIGEELSPLAGARVFREAQPRE